MSALGTRVRRTFSEHKGRHLGIVILILLGSFYFTAATGVAGSLARTLDDFATQGNQQDVTFLTDAPIDVQSVARASGAVIERQEQREVRLPGGDLRLLAAAREVNIPVVLSGRGLEKPGEILLDPQAMSAQQSGLGQQLVLQGRTFTVVGTVALPDYIYTLKGYYDVLPTAGFGVGVASPADVQSIPAGAAEAAVAYGARFTSRDDVPGQVSRLRTEVVSSGGSLAEWMPTRVNPRITTPQSNVTSMQSMALPVALAFLALGCGIVGVLVMRSVRTDSIAIGALYALGYRRGELIRHYLAVPLLLAACGTVVGTALAIPATGAVVDSLFSAYTVPDQGLWFSPLNLAAAVLGPVLLIGAAALLATRRILRGRAAELMKGDAQVSKVSPLERVLPTDRLRFATMFRVREQLRSIPRLIFLVLGVAVSSATMLFGFTFNDSMDTLTNQGAITRYQYPLEYNFTRLQNIQQNPLPQGAEPYHTIRVHPEGRENATFYLTGLQPDSVGFRLDDPRGDALPRDQVNISAPLAERLGLGPGDTIAMVDNLDGETYRLRIDGIIQAVGEQLVTLPLDRLNELTGDPPGTYGTVLAERELDFDPSQLSGTLDTRDPSAFDDLGAPQALIVTSVTTLAVAIAVIVVSLITSLIMDENRATISMMKVMGYRRREIAGLILHGTSAMVVLGYLLGIPVMLVFGKVLYGIVAEAANMVIPQVVNPVYLLIGLVVIVAVQQIVTRVLARRIDRVSLDVALKSSLE